MIFIIEVIAKKEIFLEKLAYLRVEGLFKNFVTIVT
jgi:hypothetical protein